MPKGEEHPPTDVAIDTRIRLPIVTVASRRKMNQLREFVGSVHHFCPNWYVRARRVVREDKWTRGPQLGFFSDWFFGTVCCIFD